MWKNIFVFSCLFLSTHFVWANANGQSKLDSLLKQLPGAKEDTIKVSLLIDIGKAYRIGNVEEAIRYEKLAIELSEKINYRDGISNGNYYLGRMYLFASRPDSALKCYEITLRIATEIMDTEFIAAVSTNMAGTCDMQGLSVCLKSNSFSSLL